MTELVFILDRSGSMSGLEKDTIGGFNSMLEKQRREPGDALVSTVLFNSRTQIVHNRTAIRNVPNLTEEEYVVCGSTALLDAVGSAIHRIGNIHKYNRRKYVPEKTLFIIITRWYGECQPPLHLRYRFGILIERQKRRYGWEFLFLGANIDAAAEAGRFGIDESMAANYHCDKAGTALNYEVISEAITNVRTHGAPLSADWKKRIDRDYQRTRRKEMTGAILFHGFPDTHKRGLLLHRRYL